MMTVAIYTQKNDAATLQYLKDFIKELLRRNITPIIYHKVIPFLDQPSLQGFDETTSLEALNVSLFFTFGGDGTIVTSLLFVRDSHIPIVGVNTGRLGFLASFTKEELLAELPSILAGDYQLSKRSLIEVTSPHAEGYYPFALNDVTISRKETTAMITVESYIDNEFLNIFWGDGVIISTPTGSTAYSLSCGGPIISPNNENFVITPIAPHNLNVRPLIVNDGAEFRLKIASRATQYSLSLDSRLLHMDTSVEITLRKARFEVLLVQPRDLSFYETIRQKLLWGQDKRN